MNLQQIWTGPIAILGYGLEGKSSYQFLLAHGISPERITILDQKATIEAPSWSSARLGADYLQGLQQYEVIIRSPGLTNALIQQWLDSNTTWDQIAWKLLTQTELFFANYQGKVIGITGTKWKSTISTLCYLTLQEAGLQVSLAGNIGKPILDQIDRNNQPDFVVYELSSFMLESLNSFQLEIGIFNTIYPTHLEAHAGRDNYLAAKAKLVTHSHYQLIWSQVADAAEQFSPEISQLLNHESSHLFHYGTSGTYSYADGVFYDHDQQAFLDHDIRLLGLHNRYNICAIVGVCSLLKIDYTALQRTLSQFAWLEDRIEDIGIHHGIQRFNDAIATTPQATIAAIETLGSRIETIFVGGILGDYDFVSLGRKISEAGIQNVILFPDSGTEIYKGMQENLHHIHHSTDMHEAVQRAAAHTTPGKAALLSCGSPSFSLRSSYKEKARLFKQAVNALDATK